MIKKNYVALHTMTHFFSTLREETGMGQKNIQPISFPKHLINVHAVLTHRIQRK